MLELFPKQAALVADPPYGINLRPNYGTGSRRYPDGRRVQPKMQYRPICGDEKPFDPAFLLEFPEVLLWGAEHFAHRLPPDGRWLVWDKRGPFIPPRSQSDCEFAWVKGGGSARIIRHVWDGMVRDSEHGVQREHPNQKPVEVMKWCLGFVEADTIIDPFMGSGTTGVAAVKMRRGFVGCEVEHHYFDIALRRISEALKQPDLFIERPKPPKQEAFL